MSAGPGAELLEALAWRSTTGAPQRRRIELLTAVGSDLALALADAGPRFDCRARAEALRRALDEVADATLLRILGAPEVCRAALHYHTTPSPELLDELEGWFEVEVALSANRTVLAAPRWSALGDAFLPDATAAPDAWGVSGRLAAAVARCGIVLDFDSPAARRTPKSGEQRAIKMEAPVPMTAAERALSIERIEAALAALAAACRPAYDFVTAVTRVIVPRKDGVHPDFYTSGSIRTTIGRTALNNPFGAAVTIPMLVSSLVHEAIHAYLYTVERAHPIVTDWDTAFEATAASPWTGTVLALPTYLHACFVWHGLRTLWRQPALAAAFGDAAAAEQRAIAEAGFARGITAPLGARPALVAPWIWSSLERITDAH